MIKMNIKQTLTTIIMTLNYYYSCFQGYCPTSKERKNEDIKSLASRLKAESHEETLTNILEWQERNIEFWAERHPILTTFNCICIGVFATIFFVGTISSVFPVIVNIQLVLLLLWSFVIGFIVIVSSFATTLAIMIFTLHSNRKFPWKEIPRGLWNVFARSISIDFLLKRKLGVCRDYAKLTACLLSDTYPDEKIYFAYAPSHVATGIMIKDKLYMLDQRLPVLTIEKWSDYRRPRRWHDIERFDFVNNILTRVDKKVLLRRKKEVNIDTEKLAMRMKNLLNVNEQTGDKANSILEIPWKKGAVLYEDDEVVDYSLARRLKTKISDELIRANQVTGIEIERHKDDLIFLVCFNSK
jgi:predicted transglutaminase-like protease